MTPAARRIRVLFLTDEMETGGTQRQIVQMARALNRERFEPAVAYFRERSFLVDELERAGVPVYCIPKRGRIDPGFLLRLAAFLRRERFDLVHAFSFTAELWGALARRMLVLRRPVLITSVRGTYEWYSAWQWRLKRRVSLQSARVIANSRAGAEYAAARMGVGPERIDIVYNGVARAAGGAAAQDSAALRRELDIADGEVFGLFVGRLVEHKNIPVLLRALKQLQQRLPGLHVRLAGDGPLRAQIERDIASLDLGATVRLLGQRADAERLIEACDFLVLPSFREGLSNVVLEAMMAGKAVVASRVGGNVELIEHDRSGLLFPSDDDAALAASLQTLGTDGVLRARLGAAAQSLAAERFSVTAMARALEGHYEQCVSHR